MEYTNRLGKNPWSLRKFAVYHKYRSDPHNFCSTWLLLGASQRTESCLEEYRSSIGDLKAAYPFELHLLFVKVAMAAWKPYLASPLNEVAVLVSK